MVEIPRLQAKGRVNCVRAQVSFRGTHQDGPESARGVWLPKYRKPVLTGEVAGVLDLIWQIAAERIRDHSREGGARPRARIFDVSAQSGREQDHAVAQGDQFKEFCSRSFRICERGSGAATFGLAGSWR
jgi:hypothetical protein